MADVQHSTLSGSELHEPKTHTHDTLYLKRSADDFSGFGEKSTPINADRVLLEDSADSLGKKWAQVGNLTGGGSATWTGLTDTPGSITALQIVRGNTGGTLLEMVAQSTLKLDDFGTPDDNTDLDATTTYHGLLPKLGGGTTNFLRADGSWQAPSGGGGATDHGALTGLADDDHAQYLLVNGTRDMSGDMDMSDTNDIVGIHDLHLGADDATFIMDSSGINYIIGMQYGPPSAVTIYGNLSLNNNKITTLLDPTADQDAATKKYVDDTTGSWEVSGTELQMATPRGMGMQGEDILYTGDVVPQINNLANLGSASYLWANVFATNGIFGDLGFEEKECHICKEKFVVGDVIDLVVKSIESHGIMTVPVHKECKDNDRDR